MPISDWIKAHDLARKLLEGPNDTVVIPVATFDMPGSFIAYGVEVMQTLVQGHRVVYLMPRPEPDTEPTNEPTIVQNPTPSHSPESPG